MSNQSTIEAWNGPHAERFLRFRPLIEKLNGAHSEQAFALRAPTLGERVLDLGCGLGATTRELARRVGGEGAVVGFDCSEPMIGVAREEAAREGLSNVRFLLGDAQRDPMGDDFDLCFSRFGSMFFEAPVEAFQNILRSLRPGGALQLLTWRPLADNEWLRLGDEIADRHLPPSPEPTIGPFSLSDPDLVRDLLNAAGFEAIEVEPIDFELGLEVETMVALATRFGPAGRRLRDLSAKEAALGFDVERELEAVLRSRSVEGRVTLGSASWHILARRPSDDSTTR